MIIRFCGPNLAFNTTKLHPHTPIYTHSLELEYYISTVLHSYNPNSKINTANLHLQSHIYTQIHYSYSTIYPKSYNPIFLLQKSTLQTYTPTVLYTHRFIRARFLFLAWSKLRLCSANHKEGYFSNLACDWLSIV